MNKVSRWGLYCAQRNNYSIANLHSVNRPWWFHGLQSFSQQKIPPFRTGCCRIINAFYAEKMAGGFLQRTCLFFPYLAFSSVFCKALSFNRKMDAGWDVCPVKLSYAYCASCANAAPSGKAKELETLSSYF